MSKKILGVLHIFMGVAALICYLVDAEGGFRFIIGWCFGATVSYGIEKIMEKKNG